MDRDRCTYTPERVQDLVPRAIAWRIWGILPQRPPGAPRGREDPACGGEALVEALDVLRALELAPVDRAGIRVVLRVDGQGLTWEEAARLEGLAGPGEAKTAYLALVDVIAAWLSGQPVET